MTRQLPEIKILRRIKRTLGLSRPNSQVITNIPTTPAPSVETVQDEAATKHQVLLDAAAEDFINTAHSSLRLNQVTRCVAMNVSLAIAPDFFAMAVADLENGKISVKQTVGMRLVGFNVGDVSSAAEAMNDPMSTDEIKLWRGEELVELTNQSHFAATAVGAGIRSVLAGNFVDEQDLVAQVRICSANPEAFSSAEVSFLQRISGHLKSAVINARNSESLIELQRYLVGQNERFAQMQDGVEGTEAELRLNHARLTVLNDSKTQFMSEVAHEIKTPLSVMIGYADLLRFDEDLLGTEHGAYATSIEKSARQLVVLIDDLSDIANIETGHFTTNKQHHDVLSVVNSVIDGLKVADPDFTRRIEFSGPTSGWFIDGDPARISQVITNLVTNALKYSPDDRQVSVTSVVTGESVSFLIKDQGLGISEEDIENLFTPYFRSTNPEARAMPGTGLGLFLSRSIVEDHGGTLSVSSVSGSGSTFTVELPIIANDQKFEAA
jgi:signal transduction histidine kinase